MNFSQKLLRETGVYVVICVAVALISIQHDGFERFAMWSQVHETWQVDEIFTVLIALSVLSSIFAIRRLIETTREMHAREHAEQDLRASGLEREQLHGMNVEMERQVQKRTAELRTALTAAEAANRAKSEFLTNMSHELRTPLNSVIGFAKVLAKNTDGHLPEKDLVYLNRIAANGHHLLSLINSILDLSKIEAGRVDVELAPTALGDIVRHVVDHLDGVIRDRPISLKTEIPLHVAVVDTDAEKVQQVLINLVGNALKFTETGSVTIRLIVDPVTAVPRGIEVIDTGIGIPEDRLGAIFNPFEQADNSTARKFGGTGLGLSISRSLCALLGYHLTVTSRAGYGTTFTINMPEAVERPIGVGALPVRVESQNEGHAPIQVLPMPLVPIPLVMNENDASPFGDTDSSISILIVEDDPDTQHIMTDYLRTDGVSIQVASNGVEALQMLETFTPDLILLDLMMPHMDGKTFLLHLRSNPRYEDLSVVVVTAQEVESEERAQLTRQTLGIIHKGVDLETKLHQVVGRIVGRLSARQERCKSTGNMQVLELTEPHPERVLAAVWAW